MIEKDIVAEVDAKAKKIVRPQGVSLRTALVCSGELGSHVEANGYFDAIVPITRLMGLSEQADQVVFSPERSGDRIPS